MSRDIYVSLSGASAAWANYEIIANNVANASTTGFKAERTFHEAVGPSRHALGDVYAMARGGGIDLQNGALVADAVPTHLALQGPGFFVVEDGGQQVLTRDGRFSVSAEGLLVDGAGRPVQGDGGSIEIPEGQTIRVAADGTVTTGDGAELARLTLVDGPVRAVGLNGFQATGSLTSASGAVVQGSLEASNVDPVKAMVDLVEASRMFEAYQKAMQASDDADGKLNNWGGS